MAIDIGALRAFQNTWSAVIEAIPAVINMAEQQADLDRALKLKATELQKADKEIESAFVEANARLTVLNEQLVATSNQKAEVLAGIEGARQQATKAAAEAAAKAKLALATVDQKIAAQTAVLSTVDAQINERLATATAAHTAAVASMEAEIKDLERRKSVAEKALDTLRAKLG